MNESALFGPVSLTVPTAVIQNKHNSSYERLRYVRQELRKHILPESQDGNDVATDRHNGGGSACSAGSGVLAVAGVIATALVCSLICGRQLSKAIAEIRADQARVVESLQLSEDVSAIRSEPDDILAIISFRQHHHQTIESRRKERQHLLNQIIAAEEQLKLIIHNMITGDNKEVAQVQDAVSAMESMKKAFAMLIAEIDELSGRTEERASISAEMSATTDAIAENINQYSSFVLETSSSIEEMARAAQETADNIRGLSISTEQTASAILQISASQANVRENSGRGAAASGVVRDQAQQGLEQHGCHDARHAGDRQELG